MTQTIGLGIQNLLAPKRTQNGQIKLNNLPSNVAEETKVIVTFVDSNDVDLAARGIDRFQAEALQNSLATFALILPNRLR